MTFYEPLFYYLVLLFYWLTQSYFISFKIVIALGIILSGLLMYSFTRYHWGKGGALLAAVAYMYAPYHIADIYVRGVFQEASLYVLLPALMLLVRKAVTTGRRSWVALFSLIFGISFITHPMSILFPLILAPYALTLTGRRRLRRVIPLAFAFILALGLAAFYWLPAALQKSFTYHGQLLLPGDYNYRDHFVYPFQLISPAWGWGDSVPGPADGMSFQIGIAHIIFFIFSLIALPRLMREQRRVTILFQAMALLSIFMMLPYSILLWEKLPLLNIFQFPWRLLLFINFFTSFLAGAALCNLGRERRILKRSVVVLGILLVLVLYGGYCQAIYPNRIFRSEADCTRKTILEIPVWQFDLNLMPRWVKKLPSGPSERKVTLEGEGEIEILRITPNLLSFDYSAPYQTRCVISIYYYPSWKCRIDGRPHPIQPGEPRGDILISVPAGKHHVVLKFTDPPSVVIAQIISLLSLIFIIFMLWSHKRRSEP